MLPCSKSRYFRLGHYSAPAALALIGAAPACFAADPPAQPVTPPPAAAPAVPPVTPATPASTAPAPGSITVNGLVDVYYGINFRAPRGLKGKAFGAIVTTSGETIQVDNPGRAFDINDREPSFSLGELNIVRAAGKGIPVALTATLTVGDTARIVHSTEPGGTSSWQTLQQLYMTYATKFAKHDLTLDFGKFVTPFGIEVIESSSNDNYSRSLGFLYSIPFYHAGLRATMPLGRTTLTAGLVNGWNNVADDNDGKSGFGALGYTFSSKLAANVLFMGGPEGTGAYGPVLAPKNRANIDTYLGELNMVFNPTARLKLAGVVDYGSGSGNTAGTHVSGHWLSYAGYGRYQVTPKIAIGLRAEQFEDMPGAGGAGLRLGGTYQKLQELTATLEYVAMRGHLISRLEYRHDNSSSGSANFTPLFGAGGGRNVADQDTIYLGEVYKF